MNGEMQVILKLRRDTEANYKLVETILIPASGEVCLVDTQLYGLRIKIGDGVKTFAQLPYQDTTNNVLQSGYYLNNKFYVDSTYLTELEKCTKHLYLDKNTNKFYVYNGTDFNAINPDATEDVAGLVKLYASHGTNIDGTMTQKAITEGIGNITFNVIDTDTDGVGDCLVLDLPWEIN